MGAYYSCIRGSYYSEGRTNRGGRSNRGSTVFDIDLKIFDLLIKKAIEAINIGISNAKRIWSY